jgi:2-dehydro-3-deoxygluconokinase
MRSRSSLETPKAFDVVCAGEALWNLAAGGGAPSSKGAEPMPLRFHPGGGAVNAALALAEQGLRVGLATTLDDDTFGRRLLRRISTAGIDVTGVAFAPPRAAGLVLLEGGSASRQMVSYRDEDQPIDVPAGWSSQVLLLSGLSPVLSYGATLCKAARAARRIGTTVVVDVNARLHLWAGRDPRAISTVLREADVVRCSVADLAVLGVELGALERSMRRGAVLVKVDGAGGARATGPFGDVVHAPEPVRWEAGAGDVFTAAICAELARAGHPGEDRADVWLRALQRGHAAASASDSRRKR